MTTRGYLPQRATAAFRAISLRRSGVSFFARRLQPTLPPSRPRATAAGFLLSSTSSAISEARRFRRAFIFLTGLTPQEALRNPDSIGALLEGQATLSRQSP